MWRLPCRCLVLCWTGRRHAHALTTDLSPGGVCSCRRLPPRIFYIFFFWVGEGSTALGPPICIHAVSTKIVAFLRQWRFFRLEGHERERVWSYFGHEPSRGTSGGGKQQALLGSADSSRHCNAECIRRNTLAVDCNERHTPYFVASRMWTSRLVAMSRCQWPVLRGTQRLITQMQTKASPAQQREVLDGCNFVLKRCSPTLQRGSEARADVLAKGAGST